MEDMTRSWILRTKYDWPIALRCANTSEEVGPDVFESAHLR